MQRFALTALVSLLVVSAGCTGLITGETVEFDAAEATVDDETLSSTGYEGGNVTAQTTTRNVSVGGQERTVRITNQVTQYSRSGELRGVPVSELSSFIVLSTPGAEMAGQTLNPVADWSDRRIVDQVAQRSGTVRDITFQENRTVQSLGESREVSVFNGTTERAGQEVDVRIHVTSFEHEGDVLIGVSVHPVEIDERENVDDLLGGLQHSGN